MKLALWLSAPSAAHSVHLISQVGYRNCAVACVPDACSSSNNHRRQAKQPNQPPAVAVTEDVGCEVADAIPPVRRRSAGYYPESTEAMGRGVDTRDDGQGKANGASPIPTDGDEGDVR